MHILQKMKVHGYTKWIVVFLVGFLICPLLAEAQSPEFAYVLDEEKDFKPCRLGTVQRETTRITYSDKVWSVGLTWNYPPQIVKPKDKIPITMMGFGSFLGIPPNTYISDGPGFFGYATLSGSGENMFGKQAFAKGNKQTSKDNKDSYFVTTQPRTFTILVPNDKLTSKWSISIGISGVCDGDIVYSYLQKPKPSCKDPFVLDEKKWKCVCDWTKGMITSGKTDGRCINLCEGETDNSNCLNLAKSCKELGEKQEEVIDYNLGKKKEELKTVPDDITLTSEEFLAYLRVVEKQNPHKNWKQIIAKLHSLAYIYDAHGTLPSPFHKKKLFAFGPETDGYNEVITPICGITGKGMPKYILDKSDQHIDIAHSYAGLRAGLNRPGRVSKAVWTMINTHWGDIWQVYGILGLKKEVEYYPPDQIWGNTVGLWLASYYSNQENQNKPLSEVYALYLRGEQSEKDRVVSNTYYNYLKSSFLSKIISGGRA